MHLMKPLILASRSPRRQHLLRQIGLNFEVRESNVDEEFDARQSPEENVKTISKRKASIVAPSFENAIIIGADTIVAFEKRVLGKPKDAKDASDMLIALSGHWHEVYTGVTLFDRPTNETISTVEVTKVKFRSLAPREITEYVTSGSPMDKAGAYGIQDDYGAVFVEKIEGCFYNVVGFPLAKFYSTMQTFQKQLSLL